MELIRTYVFTTLLTIGSIYCPAQDKTKNRVIETINFRTSQFDKIVLTKEFYDDHIGAFNTAIFQRNGESVFSLRDVGGYDSIDFSILEGLKNKIKSVFVLAVLHRNVNYFIFQGFQFGCCPKYLVIVKSDESGIKEIANLEFDVTKIEKRRDEQIMIYGQSSFSQGLANIDSLDVSLSSYSPVLIYNLAKGFMLDSALTKKYNEDNYVFAGYEYSEKVTVARQRYNAARKVDTFRPYIYEIKKQ